jgi:ribosomal-protein-alanine N-acetyltransferase
MNPKPPKQIELERVRLRPVTVEDAESIYEYGSDPIVARYTDWVCRTSIEPLIESIRAREGRWGEGDEYSWIISTLDDNRAIGGVRCKIEGDAAEIGFLLNRRFWGHGYAGEAASAVVDWVFTIPNVYRVWATCDTENSASARVLEKLGFAREKILLKAIVRPQISPEPRDAYLYARQRHNAQQDGGGQPATRPESK